MTGLVERITGLTLLDPGFLWLALLIAPVLWLRARRGAPALTLAPLAIVGAGALPRTWRTRLRHVPRVLDVIALLLVVVALARPAARESLPAEAEGIDILLCLDTSSSMTANDMDRQRTRLDVAREAAVDFIRGRPHDRIGLLAFARYPDVQCPLTLDHDALTTVLTELTTVVGEGPEDATGIGTAVARAAQVLDATGAASRVVILLTDGEENVATTESPGEIAPVHAGQLCQTLGIRVYAIVAGTGRPDPSGVWRTPDTRSVRGLAERTGGAFHEARDAESVARVYDRIGELERVPIEEARLVFRDRYLAFLLPALLLLLLARLLAATVLRVLP